MAPDSNNFGLLRLLAAASVVVSHAFHLATGDALAQPLAGLTRYNLGQHAVHVFFVLSGIMVAGSLDRSTSLGNFALARALRILPGLAVCALITAFLLGPIVSSLALGDYFRASGPYAYPAQVIGLAKISATLPGVFDTNPLPSVVNEPLWTLKFEALCYLILGLLALAGVWRSNRGFLAILAVSVLVFVPISATKLGPTGPTFIDNVARFWLCFLLGLALYRFRSRVPLSWLVFVGAAILWWIGRGTGFEPVLTFLLVGYGAAMLAVLPLNTLRHWTNQQDLSYGVYIYGWPLTQTLVWGLPVITPWTAAVFSLILAGVCGWLSWRFVERPSLRAREPLARWLAASFRGRIERSEPEPSPPSPPLRSHAHTV